MSKKVSVIMSVYNEREDWLKKAIESILFQTYRDIEFIVILDNPENHRLEDIILKYAKDDDRIRFFKNDINVGLVESLNKALIYVTGDYIARMDADDISVSNRIEIQVENIEKTGADLVATAMMFIDEEDKPIGYSGCYGKTSKACKESLSIRNILPHPTWLYKREMLKVVGNYHHVQTAEDYEWLCRAACAGFKMHCMDNVLFNYRIRNNGVCVGKAYQQYKMTEIVRREYSRALKENNSFNYKAIVEQIRTIDFSVKNERYDKSAQIYKDGCADLKGRRKINGVMRVLRAFIMYPTHITHFVDTIKLRKVEE